MATANLVSLERIWWPTRTVFTLGIAASLAVSLGFLRRRSSSGLGTYGSTPKCIVGQEDAARRRIERAMEEQEEG